jgi:hypothetical protein
MSSFLSGGIRHRGSYSFIGFYEAAFVKTGCENSFLLIFDSFWPLSGNNSPFRFLVFDRCGARQRAPQGSNKVLSYEDNFLSHDPCTKRPNK